MTIWKNKLTLWKRRLCATLKGEEGMGVVEVILIIVGILTPYYGVGIGCIE